MIILPLGSNRSEARSTLADFECAQAFESITLVPLVLRAETAAIATLAILVHELRTN